MPRHPIPLFVVAVLAVIGIGVGVLAGTNNGGLGPVGTVHGQLGGWESGGPSRQRIWMPLTGTVSATKGSTEVATANTGRNGDFVLVLEPGTYRLVGNDERHLVSGTDCEPTVADVRANHTVSVRVLCVTAIIN